MSQRYLNTHEIRLVKHTDCGMVNPELTNEGIRQLLLREHPGHEELANRLEFHPMRKPLQDRVREDVAWLKEHPFVLHKENITGWIYDVDTKKVREYNGRVSLPG